MDYSPTVDLSVGNVVVLIVIYNNCCHVAYIIEAKSSENVQEPTIDDVILYWIALSKFTRALNIYTTTQHQLPDNSPTRHDHLAHQSLTTCSGQPLDPRRWHVVTRLHNYQRAQCGSDCWEKVPNSFNFAALFKCCWAQDHQGGWAHRFRSCEWSAGFNTDHRSAQSVILLRAARKKTSITITKSLSLSHLYIHIRLSLFFSTKYRSILNEFSIKEYIWNYTLSFICYLI